MASDKDIAMLANRSDTTGRLPAPPLTLEPLPPEILKAFPSMEAWYRRNNDRLAQWVKSTNTALASIPTV